MKKKLFIALVSMGLIVFVLLAFRAHDDEASYRFARIEKGNVERTVVSTGQLSAVTTVQVGTQVSGIISKIFVDFNDEVEQGQVIAQIDTTLLDISVRDAQARLAQNRAQYNQAQLAYARMRRLFEQKIVTDTDYEQARYDFEAAQATISLAEVSVDRAKQNLSYATVTAPVSGIVIERNVDVGQTVAASFSAPQLFLIANDLAKMQILVTVDESDIVLIKQGQSVHFTVQAYAHEIFSGVVRQVRLQSKVEENVVSYTAVVDVDNKGAKLLPGMTASVEFLVESVTDVLKVSNSAIRFRPTEEMMLSLGSEAIENYSKSKNATILWRLGKDGGFVPMKVEKGISDNQTTHIIGDELREGMQVISGIIKGQPSSGKNPFQAQQQQRRRDGF